MNLLVSLDTCNIQVLLLISKRVRNHKTAHDKIYRPVVGNRPSAAQGGRCGLTVGHTCRAMAYLLQGPSTTGNKPPRIERIERIERIGCLCKLLWIFSSFNIWINKWNSCVSVSQQSGSTECIFLLLTLITKLLLLAQIHSRDNSTLIKLVDHSYSPQCSREANVLCLEYTHLTVTTQLHSIRLPGRNNVFCMQDCYKTVISYTAAQTQDHNMPANIPPLYGVYFEQRASPRR